MARTTQTARRFSICVGINTYAPTSGLADLRFAEADAQAVDALLGDLGFPAAHRRLLLGAEATLDVITAALGEIILDTAKRDDLVVFFFAGHGKPVTIGEGEAAEPEVYLASYDFDPSQAQRRSYQQRGLSMSRLRDDYFVGKGSRKRLFIFDSCYSGEFPGPGYRNDGDPVEGYIQQLLQTTATGRVALTSCLPTQKAMEDPTLGHGRLTYHLLRALRGEEPLAKRSNGDITVGSIFDYLSEALAPQCPVLSGTQHESFVLVRYDPPASPPPPETRSAPDHQEAAPLSIAPLTPSVDPTTLAQARTLLASLPVDSLPPPASLPEGSRMPLLPNPRFVGRQEVLAAMAHALTAEPRGGCPTIAITGLAGVGKTQLANELAYRFGPFFAGGVFWLSCADPTVLPREVAACGQNGMPGLRSGFAQLGLEDQVRAVRNIWLSPLPRLLIFDNCEDIPLLQEWRPTMGGCRIVLTSQRSRWPIELGVVEQRLEPLSPEDSITLLNGYDEQLASERGVVAEIAKEMGYLPLALHLAGSFLQDYHHTMSPRAYLEDLRRPGLLNHPSLQRSGYSPTGYEQHVGKAFALSFERLDSDNPQDLRARELLSRAACLAPGERVPWKLLAATLEQPATRADEDALRRLVETGLLEMADGSNYRMHRLVATFVTAQTAPELVKAVTAGLLSEAEVLIEAHQLLPGEWLPHLRHVVHQLGDRTDDVAVRLQMMLGRVLQDQGEYEAARPLLDQALAIREHVLGDSHPDTAVALTTLGSLLRQQGEYETARSVLERALAIQEQIFGTNQPDIATTLTSLGDLLAIQGEYEAAQSALERSLSIREQVLGADHPNTATTLNTLGDLLLIQGEYEAGQPLLERALAIREQVLGTTHPATAETLNSLGNLLQEQGEYEAAQSLLERSLAIREQVPGPTHPDTAATLNTLGNLLQQQGEYEAARSVLERSLAIREQVLGATHLHTAATLNNLGNLLRLQGEYEAARPVLERALVIAEQVLGLNHPDTGTALNNLALVLKEQKEYEAAQPLLERSLVIAEQVLGPDHPDTATSRNNVAMVLFEQGDYTHARPMLEQALASYDALFGAGHPTTFTMLGNLATISLSRGHIIQARQYLTRALEVSRHNPTVSKVMVKQMQRQLGQLGGPLKGLARQTPKGHPKHQQRGTKRNK